MNVLLFGATGMVGQGVLRECLQAADVECVLTVGRTATGQQHPKLRERVHPDLLDYRAMERPSRCSKLATSAPWQKIGAGYSARGAARR